MKRLLWTILVLTFLSGVAAVSVHPAYATPSNPCMEWRSSAHRRLGFLATTTTGPSFKLACGGPGVGSGAGLGGGARALRGGSPMVIGRGWASL